MQLSIKEKQRLKTKYGSWAVVTGATSGIGLELVMQLAQCGLNLVINARNASQLATVAANIKRLYGVEVLEVAVDLATNQGANELITQTKHLPVGLLVASAGFGTSGLFIHNTVEDEVNMLRVNCEAVLVLTHHFSQQFAQQKRGGIVLLSSLVAFQGVPFAANYAATKAYIQTLAEGLHVELKPFGVDVLAVAPGPVETGFGSRANLKMSGALKPGQLGVPILKALGRKATVLPGFLSKFLIYSLAMLPRWGKVKAMKVIMGGMTKHQRT